MEAVLIGEAIPLGSSGVRCNLVRRGPTRLRGYGNRIRAEEAQVRRIAADGHDDVQLAGKLQLFSST
jgi:hypothetical protein